jgi:hypothetical protein
MYTRSSVRRILTLALLLATFGSWVSPLFAEPESRLPACCRRKGGHKCGMKMDYSTPPGGAITGLRGKCSQYPSTPPAIPPDNLFAIAGPTRFFNAPVFPVDHSRIEESEARYRVSQVRSRQKRGPPSLPSFGC